MWINHNSKPAGLHWPGADILFNIIKQHCTNTHTCTPTYMYACIKWDLTIKVEYMGPYVHVHMQI